VEDWASYDLAVDQLKRVSTEPDVEGQVWSSAVARSGQVHEQPSESNRPWPEIRSGVARMQIAHQGVVYLWLVAHLFNVC
jgi:hypothetical protein